jgi:hypothetical protein
VHKTRVPVIDELDTRGEEVIVELEATESGQQLGSAGKNSLVTSNNPKAGEV